VVDDPSPNAFALPGGWIIVTTGLLDRIRTENELAFVLGHELGHFRNRDHLRGLGRGVAWGIVSATLGLGDGAASTLARVAGGLSNRHFDRDQESDADEVGLELLEAEYGHVGGATAVFTTVLAEEGDRDGQDGPEGSPSDGAPPDAEREDDSLDHAVDVVAGWLSTHPANADRTARLARWAADRGYAAEGESTAWPWPPSPLARGAADQGAAGPE
jgi:Zn-dependent protease with chaperone function